MTELLKPKCRFVYIYQENSGLAKARNQGIKRSKGDIVLFIDDDILASYDLVKEHYEYHLTHPKSVVKGWVNHVSDMENLPEPKFTWADYSTAFFWTSNVSVEKKYLVEAGFFDEDFREYGWEDLELGLRLKELGLRSVFNKKALVYHYKKELSKDNIEGSFKVSRAKGRTAVLFCHKKPQIRVYLATGNHFLRFLLNDFYYFGSIGERIFRDSVDKSRGNLKGFSLFSAKRLIDFEYFKALKEEKKNWKRH